VELNYKSFGQGEPLIVLHGLFGALDNWQTIGKALAENHLVFLIDQRNHGRSPHLDDISYPILADDLRTFMETHWIYRANILGHSMGGKTAMQFALHYPDMVERLIVVDIAPKQYLGGHEDIFRALLDMQIDRITSRQEAEDFLSRRIPSAPVLQFLLKNITRQTDGSYSWKMNLPVLYRHYHKLLANIEGEASYDGPALFLRGELSSYVLAEDIATIHRFFTDVQVETIPDAGHWVHAEAPQAVIQQVNSFIGRTTGLV
jgi:esterase